MGGFPQNRGPNTFGTRLRNRAADAGAAGFQTLYPEQGPAQWRPVGPNGGGRYGPDTPYTPIGGGPVMTQPMPGPVMTQPGSVPPEISRPTPLPGAPPVMTQPMPGPVMTQPMGPPTGVQTPSGGGADQPWWARRIGSRLDQGQPLNSNLQGLARQAGYGGGFGGGPALENWLNRRF